MTRNSRRSNTEEVLLDNIVDKDIQSMLFPLNILQNITLCPKYCLRDDFITPHTTIYTVVSLCAAYIAIYVYRAYSVQNNEKILVYFNFLNIFTIIDVFFYSIGIIMNFIVNVVQTQQHIRFVLIYQDIHRFLNSGIQKQNKLKRFIIWNWISLLMICCFYCIFVVYNHLKQRSLAPGLSRIVLICFDVNIIYSIALLRLLVDKLLLLDDRIQKLQTQSGGDDDHCEKIFQAYLNVLECYNNYADSYRKAVRLWLSG